MRLGKSKDFSLPWCFENFVQSRSLRRTQDGREQLLAILDKFFFMPPEKTHKRGRGLQLRIRFVHIRPSSALFQRQPGLVIYNELIITTEEYMRNVTSIDPKELTEVAPRFFKVANPTKLSKRKCKERIQPLHDKYHEHNSWQLSKRLG